MTPLAGEAPGEIGGYEILCELSRGGMGAVFLARQRKAMGFEKLVALKTILARLSRQSELRAMFLDEAVLLSKLQHPNVAQIHDFGEHEENLYLAMEYVAGVDLAVLAGRGCPVRVAALALAAACRGLHAAHELVDLGGHPLGVVHRDVSPENIRMSFDGHVKVIDFGIALVRGRSAPVTEMGTIKGKPPYLSPEQIRGTIVDRRTDVFAASAVLHELLTGETLFSGPSIYATANAIISAEIPPPSALRPDVPRELDAIVLHGLERDADRRTATAGQLADELEAWAGKGPSLSAYAGAALAEDRARHRAWLKEALADTGRSPVGRATGVVTAQAERPQPDSEGLDAERGTERDGPVQASTRARRRFLAGSGLALVVAAAGVLLVTGGESPRGAATSVADSGPADALVPPPAAPDATVADAASPAADASESRRPERPSRARDRGGEKRDVGRPAIAPAPRSPAPEPAEPGTVKIVAEPYAMVRIDGIDAGSTPILGRRLAAGRHTIELIRPDSGTVRHRVTIDLPAGGERTVRAPAE